MRKIYVDFNTMMREPVDLVKLSADKLPDHSLFRESERIVLFDEEMEVEATIFYSKRHPIVMAQLDWATRIDLLPAASPQDTNAPQ